MNSWPIDRLGRPGDVAEAGVVGRHVAPAEHREPGLANRPLEDLVAPLSDALALGSKDHGDAVLGRFGQSEAQRLGFGGEELVGDLQQHAGAVAGRFVGPGRAAVHQVQQHAVAVAR